MRINRTLGTILTLASIGLFTLMPFKESKADISAEVKFRSKYLTPPGFVFAEEPVMQPSLTYFNNGFYGVLGSNVSSEEGLNEIDYIIGYNRDLGGINLDFGGIGVDLRNQGESNANDDIYEAWIALKKKGFLIPGMNLTGKVTRNISAGSFDNPGGSNFDISLSYDQEEGAVPFSFGALLNYNDRYFIPDSRLSVAQFSASIPWTVKGFTITPKFLYQGALDRNNFRDDREFSLAIKYPF